MIGLLPKKLEVDGVEYDIRSDYRIALLILEAYNDPDLSYYEKAAICVKCLFEKIPKNFNAALEKAVWFLDGGDICVIEKKEKKIIDWKQDEQLIFSALNKVAGYEIRVVEYLHWWSFLGLFNEIGEGLFSTVIQIRRKKNNNERLDKYEQKFYNANKKLIDLKVKYSLEEQKEIDELNKLLS